MEVVTGIIKSIDSSDQTARVMLPERGDIISAPLRYLTHVTPRLDAVAVCIYPSKNSTDGYIIGIDGS